jgi:hypothetical protein
MLLAASNQQVSRSACVYVALLAFVNDDVVQWTY